MTVKACKPLVWNPHQNSSNGAFLTFFFFTAASNVARAAVVQTMKKACLTHTESHSGTCGIFGQYLLFMSSTLDEEKYLKA